MTDPTSTIPSPSLFGNEEATNPRGAVVMDEDLVLASDTLEVMRASQDEAGALAATFAIVRHDALDGWLTGLHEQVLHMISLSEQEMFRTPQYRPMYTGRIAALREVLERFPLK